MKRICLALVCICSIWIGSVDAATFSHEYLSRHEPHRCTWFDRGTHFVINQSCLEDGFFPQLDLADTMESLRPYIVDVTTTYSVDKNDFYYTDAGVIFDQSLLNLVAYWEDTEKRHREINGGFVQIPTRVIAYRQFKEWSSFASVRDVSTYGPCRLQNYTVAMNQLDGVTIQPGDLLNMNKIIARQPGYCTGGSNYLFYQGACGGSTQLFRNGMINPFLEVTKRHAHGMRYAGFYGSNLMGDDASMYERGKQMEVKNISDKQIYMMTFTRPSDKNTILLSVYPGHHDMKSYVQKQQTGEKSAVVSSTVFDKDESIVYTQERVSHYRGIDTTVDETATASLLSE